MKDTLALELEKQRTLHFNAPGFRSQEVVIAPDIDPIKSKRKPLIDEEVSILSYIIFYGELHPHVLMIV